jgi:hypothetical protein
MFKLLHLNVLWDIPNSLLEKYRRWSQKNRQQKLVEEEEEENRNIKHRQGEYFTSMI